MAHQITLYGDPVTSASALASFKQAMVARPEAQRRPCTEIDAVVDEGRMSVFSDSKKLSYHASVMKDIHWWRPEVLMSVPQALSKVRSSQC